MGVKRSLAAISSLIALAPSAASAEGDAGAGRAKADQERCIECHGADGVATAPDRPNLAGQKVRYLARQLRDFRLSARGARSDSRLGDRQHPVMNAQARDLSDQDIEDIAAWFAALPCGPRGEALERPSPQKATRCAICHGADGFSGNTLVPNIGGQNRPYLAQQLLVYRESAQGRTPWMGNRRQHPMMTPQSVPLTDDEIGTLANYFAGLDCRW